MSEFAKKNQQSSKIYLQIYPFFSSRVAQKLQLIAYSEMLTLIPIYIVTLAIIKSAHSATTYTLSQQFITNHFTDQDIIGNGWVYSGTNPPSHHYFTQCADKRIVGGYGVIQGDISTPSALSKLFTNLPPHYQATISMKLYKIDSWDNQKMFIVADGISVDIITWNSATGSTDICGETNPFINTYNPQFNEKITVFSKSFTHTSSTLTIQLVSSLDSWTGSWGFRDFSIILSKCPPSCLTCSNSSVCQTCDTGLTLVGAQCQCSPGLLRLTTQPCDNPNCVSCISSPCPAGYYDFSTSLCAACSSACGQCTGPGALSPDCTSCASDYILDSGECAACLGFCSSCNSLSALDCDSCSIGAFHHINKCLFECLPGFYPKQSTAQCVNCSSPCTTCDGISADHCLSCIAGQYLYETTCYSICPHSMYGYDRKCQPACPLGTYADISLICQPCPTIYCQTCDSTGACGRCASGSFYNPTDSICYNPCPAGTYNNPTYQICIACHASCLTCSGATSSDCTSCPPLSYLVYNSCYTVCPPHTFSASCQLCHDSCLNCTGPASNQCTSCNNFELLHLNHSQCLIECYEGDIANNEQLTCMSCSVGYVGQFGQCKQCASTCLSCFGRSYLQCLSCSSSLQPVKQIKTTCVLQQNQRIIFMPNMKQSNSVIYDLLMIAILSTLGLALILQIFFMFKTPLLVTLQLMQFLSYFYYMSAPLSQSTQKMLLFLYHAHPTYIINAYNILPSLKMQHPSVAEDDEFSSTIFVKALLMDKSGVYLKDTLYLHLLIVICGIILGIAKISKGWLNSKINPYIVSYTFRLVFMELCLGIFLFLTSINLSTSGMRWSLALLCIDFIALGASFFWKVRTDTQLNHAHYALFYFNELGKPMNSRYQGIGKSQRKSILPSMIYYFGKLPLIIIILFFEERPFTQAICLLIYCVLMMGINFSFEYRRKMYRNLTYFFHISVIGAAIFLIFLSCNRDVSNYFDLWILISFMALLAATLLQLISNHQLLSSVYFYCRWKLSGKK